MDFEKKYSILKDKIITNFNYWLDNYIMIDISEAGEVDYLISDIDEYYFCLELENELTFCINNLIETDKRDLLINFTELKRLNNKRIINNTYYNEDDINEIYGISPINKTIYPFICLHPNIKDSDNLLKNLYESLFQKGFIECKEYEFKALFKKKESIQKVIWHGRLIDILGFINYLELEKIISSDNLTNTKIAFKYFKRPQEDFKLRSLEVKNSYINQNENTSKYQPIIDIVKNLS